MNFLGSPNSRETTAFHALQAHAQASGTLDSFSGSLHLEGSYTLNRKSLYYIEAPEAYLGGKVPSAPVELGVGRKLVSWTGIDDEWGLGIWQPRMRWDYLNPTPVGMTGAYLTARQGDFEFVGMASPISVPDRGEPFELEGGEFESSGPWFIHPPSSVEINGNPTPVRYSIDMPSTSEIIMHPAVSLMARWGQKTGPWASAAYAYKPINQILMSMDPVVRIHEAGRLAEDTLHPFIAYHELRAIDAGYNEGNWRFRLSGLSESPERRALPDDWIRQNLASALLLSPVVEWDVWGKERYATTLKFSYLKKWGGDAPDSGPESNPAHSLFESRYIFQNAIRFGLKSPLPWNWGQKFEMNSRLTYDFDQAGSILSTTLTYAPASRWRVLIGADVLTSYVGDQPHSTTSNFINEYRTNDRVQGGVSYVF